MSDSDLSNQMTSPSGDPSLKQYLVDEFVEDYQEGRLSRRDLLKRLVAITGSVVAANTILAACAPPTAAPTLAPLATSTAEPTGVPTPAAAPTAAASPSPAATGAAGVTVSPNDPAIQAEAVQFPGQGATIMAYLARPRGDGPFPAVLVCHENRGLQEHIKDVARRFAKENYVALAVDLLSRQGGTDKIADPAQVPGILSNTPPEQLVGDFRSGLEYLRTLPYVSKDRAGMVGFCFGGGVTWRCATQMPELNAAVPFYGPNPPLEDVPKIQAAVLAIYAERDARITGASEAVEAAMRQNGKTFEKVVYPNADHAFFNDTGQRYAPEAARQAWARTLEWFQRYLRG